MKALNDVTESYTYDDAGRTTSVTSNNQTTTLSYDYESRLTQITYPNSTTNTFTYNALDTRVGKVDSGGTKAFKRDGVGVTAPVLSDGSAAYTPGVAERRGGTSKFYHGDYLNSITRETDSSQATTATKQYDAFGMPLSSTGSSASPFGFAGCFGYQEDGDSGLKLLGHRYYDPSTGRFLTRDPAMDGRNWYGYCRNDPYGSVDPSGLQNAGLPVAYWTPVLPDAPSKPVTWSMWRYFYTGDPYASDDVYDIGLKQGWSTLCCWSKHFAIDNGWCAPPAAAAIGPLPKGLPRGGAKLLDKIFGKKIEALLRDVQFAGKSSKFTSGARVASICRPDNALLKKTANGVAKHAGEFWVIYEAGIAWWATSQTVNDPDQWLPDNEFEK